MQVGDLGGERVGQALQGELARGVQAPPGERDQADDRGDVDDVPGPGGPHLRQDRAQHVPDAEDLHVEHLPDLASEISSTAPRWP